ncbi:MAG TPA: hypothetical protein PK771_04985 [Spirochaetota bacterium]|nr:hypothetical protein [Spirochaetota bacterium]
MKFFILFLFGMFFLTSCFNSDPLFPIRRLSRNEDLAKKEEASNYYKQAIDVMVEAYSSYAGLNRDIGIKLLNRQEYKMAIKHLEISLNIKNNDSSAFYWLGVCYVNLYKIEKNRDYLDLAEKNYTFAINVTPENKEYLYALAQLQFYGFENYEKAIEILKNLIFNLNADTKENYFLLARGYYMIGDYKSAYQTYNEIYKFKKQLSKIEKEKLEEFIQITRGNMTDE